jgi:hypothetical protein
MRLVCAPLLLCFRVPQLGSFALGFPAYATSHGGLQGALHPGPWSSSRRQSADAFNKTRSANVRARNRIVIVSPGAHHDVTFLA